MVLVMVAGVPRQGLRGRGIGHPAWDPLAHLDELLLLGLRRHIAHVELQLPHRAGVQLVQVHFDALVGLGMLATGAPFLFGPPNLCRPRGRGEGGYFHSKKKNSCDPLPKGQPLWNPKGN